MVFLIQNTQNRDTEAIQLKLDELIRISKEAHNELLDIEEQDEKALNALHMDYRNLAQEARQEAQSAKGEVTETKAEIRRPVEGTEGRTVQDGSETRPPGNRAGGRP